MIRVLLVDDHEMIRMGLKSLLSQEADFEIVGEAADGRTAVASIAKLSPDVVVMDLRMADLNGIDATRQALAVQPGLKIVALSANADRRSVMQMLQAGAHGYVLKDAAFEELATAIRMVMRNETFLSPSVARIVVEHYGADPQVDEPDTDVLSPREREVLQLIAEGNPTKKIAAMLHVSVKTAETHRRNMMEKLAVESVAELTRYAIREGLTGVD